MSKETIWWWMIRLAGLGFAGFEIILGEGRIAVLAFCAGALGLQAFVQKAE